MKRIRCDNEEPINIEANPISEISYIIGNEIFNRPTRFDYVPGDTPTPARYRDILNGFIIRYNLPEEIVNEITNLSQQIVVLPRINSDRIEYYINLLDSCIAEGSLDGEFDLESLEELMFNVWGAATNEPYQHVTARPSFIINNLFVNLVSDEDSDGDADIQALAMININYDNDLSHIFAKNSFSNMDKTTDYLTPLPFSFNFTGSEQLTIIVLPAEITEIFGKICDWFANSLSAN